MLLRSEAMAGVARLKSRSRCRAPLAHDDLEPGGLHPGLLKLLVGAAGVDALMLAHVADEQDAVVGRKAVEERVQLSRAGETRLVEHVEVSAVAVCRFWAGEMPLQGAGRDAGLFQLLRRARGGRV